MIRRSEAALTRTSRPRLARWLLVLPWLVLSLAPLLERGESQSRAHVEAGGIAKHFGHHHEDCAACSSHRVAGSVPQQHHLPEVRTVVGVADILRIVPELAGERSSTRPRAPPLLVQL